MENIRPQTLNDYVGQEEVKKKMSLYISCFKKKGLTFPHTLIFSGPGRGKTTLCRILANELGVDFIEVFSPTLKTADDLFKIFCNGGKSIKPNTILFADEIHAIPQEVQEILYPIMEDGIIMVGSKKYKVPPITIIGGTTEAGKITKPLYDRFIEKCVLADYTEQDLIQLGTNTAKKLNLNIEQEAMVKLVNVCSKTPRVLNNLVRAVRIFCIAYDIELFKSSDVLSFLSFQGIDSEGFNSNDRTYVKVLYNNLVDGIRQPCGFVTICKKGNLIKNEVENLIEPKLLLKEYISFSGKGRYLTDKGLEYAKKLQGQL